VIRHVAGIAEIVEDVEAAVAYYRAVLGLDVEHEAGAQYAVVQVPGVLHYGVWGRGAAARSTFGDPGAAHRVPLGFTVGFEVESIEDASGVAGRAGCDMAQGPRTEPWGQRTARFLSVSGALCEFSETPWARRITQELKAAGKSNRLRPEDPKP